MFAVLLNQHQSTIAELRRLVQIADAQRASQLLIDTCKQFPLLAGIITMMRGGQLTEAINNVGMFAPELAADLRNHIDVLVDIRFALNRSEVHTPQLAAVPDPYPMCNACNLHVTDPIHTERQTP